MYTPKPIDTSMIVLSPELVRMAETLAENVHDVWAQGRIAEGWTYGPQRDDAKKHHPCLVPYEELSDSEKEYDRQTAFQTLRLVQAINKENAFGSGKNLVAMNPSDFAFIIKRNGYVEAYGYQPSFQKIWKALRDFGMYEKDHMIAVVDADRDPICPSCGECNV